MSTNMLYIPDILDDKAVAAYKPKNAPAVIPKVATAIFKQHIKPLKNILPCLLCFLK